MKPRANLVLLTVLGLFGPCLAAAHAAPVVTNGAVDLSNSAFSEPIALDGEWGFAWRNWSDPAGPFAPGTARVPANWNSVQASNTGYATYHLTIHLPKRHLPLAVRIPAVHSAWILWVNGAFAARSGTPGLRRNQEVPGRRTWLAQLPESSTARLVWQISNFSHHVGGPTQSVVIGQFRQLHNRAIRHELLVFVTCGVFALLAIYAWSLYFRRGQQKHHLWFSVLVVVLGAEFLFSSDAIVGLVPRVSDAVWFNAEQISYIWLIPAFAQFLNFSRPGHLSIRIVRWLMLGGLIASAATMLFSMAENERFLVAYLALAVVPLLYLFGRLVRSWRTGDATTPSMLVCSGMLFGAYVFDVVSWHFSPSDTLASGYIALLWVVVQTVTLSDRPEQSSGAIGVLPKQMVRAIQEQTSGLAAKVKVLEATVKNSAADTFAQTALLAALGHDLRTPMNGVLGAAQALQSVGLTGESKSLVELILHSGKNMNVLLGRLLDLCRNPSSSLETNPANFDLPKMLHNSIELVRPQAQRKQLRLELSSFNVPRTLCTDEVHVQEILLNLLGNAIRYTQKGRIDVRIAFPHQPGPGEFTLEVIDTGEPIPAQHRARIFDRYYQVESSANDSAGNGHGLGLYICRMLAENMGGSIELCSARGPGNCFRVRLPYAPVTNDVIAEPQPEPQSDECTVLLVDDQALNHRVLESICEALGHNMASAYNAAQAQSWIDSGVDLVLMDLRMPEMSGFELAASIRARPDYAAGNPPLVLCSADQPPAELDGKWACFDDYLAKPVMYDDFTQLIARLEKKLACSTGESVAPLERIRADLGPKAFCAILVEGIKALRQGIKDLEALARMPDPAESVEVLHRMKSATASLGLMELHQMVLRTEFGDAHSNGQLMHGARQALEKLEVLATESGLSGAQGRQPI